MNKAVSIPVECPLEYDCADYVFYTVLNESWYRPKEFWELPKDMRKGTSWWGLYCDYRSKGRDLRAELWTNTNQLLKEMEFQTVDNPQDLDVVAIQLNKPIPYGPLLRTTTHFGIYNGGSVMSKIPNESPRLDSLTMVTGYGDKAVFFRKA